VRIIGMSRDPIDALEAFREKYGLRLTFLSDPDHRTHEAYGAWGRKSMYGRTYMGIRRSTVLIGPDGRIARIWPKVNVDGHAEEVLAAARAL